MRINQYLAHCGICSRRKAEELIKNKEVYLNDVLVENLATEVNDGDKVTYKGNVVTLEKEYVYYMLNKPKGYMCTVSDDQNRPTVLDIVKSKVRIYPVGRLDYNTEGLLLLTNDGEWANKVIHPSSNIYKTYKVLLKTRPRTDKLDLIRDGVEYEGVKYAPANVTRPVFEDGLYSVNVTISEGKNREIRNIFEAVGYKVFALKRISIGKLRLGDLPVKSYRKLTEKDKKLIFER